MMGIFGKKKADVAPRVALVSLGCPKNQVNGERMLASLQAAGFVLSEQLSAGADAVIVNTCGFIDDAKREAIEHILGVVTLKEEGLVKKIIVTGCLAERYRDEIFQEIPEVDAVLGLGANDDIARLVREVLSGARLQEFPPLSCLSLGGERLRSTGHWAYLQIADGCSNCCSYCKIPELRGGFRSRPVEEILEEAHKLSGEGVREFVIIAQDVTAYGSDLYGEVRLPELLRGLCAIEGVAWVRLMYCYPDEVTEELIALVAEEPKIVKYLDLPLQHVDDRLLHAMKRRGTVAEYRSLLETLRAKVPGISIRTTFITGFPGEDLAAFEALSGFVEEQRFTHAGCFAFSPQEGTVAASLPDAVESEEALRRCDALTQQQMRVVETLLQEKIGEIIEVMVDEFDAYSDGFTGHSAADCPEVDNFVVFTSARHLQAGDVVRVEVLGVQEGHCLGREVL